MNSGAGDTTQLVPGFPIRTPWDHSSVDSSPRPIAASHVLHRLLVPRHPPCALSNLTTKMLASTVQFSTNTQPTTTRAGPHPPGHCPHTSSRSPSRRTNHTGHTGRGCSFRTQQGVHRHHQPHHTLFPTTRRWLYSRTWPLSAVTRQCLRHRAPHRNIRPVRAPHRFRGKVLLRKEVIQPHLPVRLPCYDFVPIASPTFDGSLHKGWATGFGCCRLS